MKKHSTSGFVRLLLVALIAASTLVGWSQTAGAVPVPWKNCGQAGDIISVQKFDASVWPPQAGHSLTFNLGATVGKDVVSGAYELVTLTLPSGRKFGPRRQPVEPMKAGPINLTQTFTVPLLPSGSVYVIHRDAYNADGQRILCIDLSVPIK